jgi:beta-lactamase class A
MIRHESMKTLARSLMAGCILLSGSLSAASSPVERLEREIGRISRVAPGIFGAAAIHVESGKVVRLNAAEPFPMASTYKVPIAVQLLHLVDEGQVRLDSMIEIRQSDLHPGSGTLARLFDKPGVALSIRNLLELMMVISDNSATDILLRVAGGPPAVTGRMRALGIEGIRIDRSTLQLHADIFGVDKFPPEGEWTPKLLGDVLRSVPKEKRETARRRYASDPLDTSTPDAMVRLLARVCRKDLLKPESAALLLDIMQRCQTGASRIRGMLPPGTVVANKTGSSEGVLNDVGIITLPEGAGHVAVAAFVKGADGGATACERAIAEVSRAAYDFFLFQRSE